MKKPSKTQSKPVYRLDDQIGFILRSAFQFHTAIFMARMIEGLTQTQFATLAKVHETGECSQSDLVRLIGLDSATINGVIGRMIARGFLNVTEDPNDRRRQFVSLTREGLAVVEQAEVIGSAISEETLSSLSPTEQARLIQLLRKMKEPSRAHQRWTQSHNVKMPRTAPGRSSTIQTDDLLGTSVHKEAATMTTDARPPGGGLFDVRTRCSWTNS